MRSPDHFARDRRSQADNLGLHLPPQLSGIFDFFICVYLWLNRSLCFCFVREIRGSKYSFAFLLFLFMTFVFFVDETVFSVT